MDHSATLVRCPICRRSFKRSESTAMPFCSDRCRLIDLGRWMGERYAVVAEPETDEADTLSDEASIPRPA